MWSRRKPPERRSELEAALGSLREEPSADFVDALSRRLVPEGLPSLRAWSRLVFAAAVSVFILGTFASFGGLSYAASGATSTYKAVEQVVVKHKLTVAVKTSSASDQYPKQPLTPPVVSPTKKSYKSPKHHVAAVKPVQSNTLPFTGFSLVATFVLSLALIGAGIALRRRERRN